MTTHVSQSAETRPPFGAEVIYRYALWYHSLGFNVVPLERPEKGQTKKPTCRWKGWQSKRQDARELAALHSRTTEDNEPHWQYGIMAVDGVGDLRHFDLDKATSYQPVETILTALGLPADYPWVVQSGGGQGFHICFRCADGDVTGHLLPTERAGGSPKAVYFGEAKQPEQFDHLELRWHAALTTLPPSAHWSGGRYTFVNGQPRELPPYVPLELVITAFQAIAIPKHQREEQAQASQKVTSLEQFRAQRTNDEHLAQERWAQKALDEELWQLSKARNGNRNEQLNRAAYALGQITASGLLCETDVIAGLFATARQIGLTEQEIAPTINSGLSAGKQQPRTPPPLAGKTTRTSVASGNPASTQASSPPPAPVIKRLIVVNNRQEQEVVEEALDALQDANTPPCLFVRSGKLVRVKVDERGHAHIEQVSEPMLRLRLIEIAEWAKYNVKGELKHASPTTQIVQDLLAKGSWPFPALEGITEIPLVRPDGSLLTAPGYDEATGMVYIPHRDLALPPIPDAPTQAQAEQALGRIWGVIGEFPYVDFADRANSLGLLLTPFLRRAFGGHVPMAIVDAPKQGTGKGLLTDVNAIVATGESACPLQESKDDEEWRKAITSSLLAGSSLIVIDNVDRTLRSGRLSSALTLHTWADRLLAKNEIVHIPFKVTWIANGNNVKLGGDMGSRAYRIRLDAKCSNPAGRDHFTHQDLLAYASQHRGEIIADLLTIIRFWYVSGRPIKLMPRMRTFSEWATLVGSILDAVGIHEFLGNLEQMKQDADERENQMYVWFRTWHDTLGEAWTPTRTLIARMISSDANTLTELAESLPDFLAEARAEKPNTFHVRLGQTLRGLVDSCFGPDNLCLERKTDSHSGQPLWRVVCRGTQSVPQPLPLFAPPVEASQNTVAGVAGVDLPSQADPDSSVSPVLEHGSLEGISTPATPAASAGQESVENTEVACEEASQGEEEPGDQERTGEVSMLSPALGTGCQVQFCQETAHPSESEDIGTWCGEHSERGEIMRVGALVGYPALEVFGCSVGEGRESWLHTLGYRQARVRNLLAYLKEYYPMHS